MQNLIAIVACLSLIGPRLHAQACDATSAPDSLPASLVARFTAVGDRDSVAQGDADSLTSQLHSMLHVPDPVPIPVWTPSIGKTVPSIHGDYELRIDRDGSIRDVRVVRSSLVGSIDSGLVAALRASALPPRKDRSRLVMHASLRTPQAIPHFIGKVQMAEGVDTTKRARPSSPIPLVEFTHKVPAWPTQEKLPALVYAGRAPDAAAGRSGTVIVDAVVDEKGRVVRGSVYHDLPVNESAFDVARMVAEGYEFKPFTINGCAVKLYMMMPIVFAGRR